VITAWDGKKKCPIKIKNSPDLENLVSCSFLNYFLETEIPRPKSLARRGKTKVFSADPGIHNFN
jgi:hypothetical protein